MGRANRVAPTRRTAAAAVPRRMPVGSGDGTGLGRWGWTGRAPPGRPRHCASAKERRHAATVQVRRPKLGREDADQACVCQPVAEIAIGVIRDREPRGVKPDALRNGPGAPTRCPTTGCRGRRSRPAAGDRSACGTRRRTASCRPGPGGPARAAPASIPPPPSPCAPGGTRRGGWPASAPARRRRRGTGTTSPLARARPWSTACRAGLDGTD